MEADFRRRITAHWITIQLKLQRQQVRAVVALADAVDVGAFGDTKLPGDLLHAESDFGC